MVKAVRDAAPNKALRQLRDRQAWSQKDAVIAFNDLAAAMSERVMLTENTLSRYERGVIAWPDACTRKVLAALYDVTPASLGFRREDGASEDLEEAPSAQQPDSHYEVVSHKFVPAFIGAEQAQSWQASMTPTTCGWLPASVAQINHPSGQCDVYVFPFGVAVFHVREEKRLSSLGQLAVWRRSSYEQTRAWATSELRSRLPDRSSAACPAVAEYVLSLYWLQSPIWHEPRELSTAMGLLSMPSVMVDRDPASDAEAIRNAEDAEAKLLEDGFDHSEIFEFGLRGVSVGCASWSGLSYYALAPKRSLQAQELADFELVVQALWCYSDHIVRCSRDELSPEHGRRFLKSCSAEMRLARSRESTQHRLMRDAVLETSRLPDLVTQAQEILDERELTMSRGA